MLTGRLWSDVVQRITLSGDTGKVFCMEHATTRKHSGQLDRALPEGVNTIRTILAMNMVV